MENETEKLETTQVDEAEKAHTEALKAFFDKPLLIEDPISVAFKTFLKGKRRYWQPKTARQIFTDGFLAGQRHTIDNMTVELKAEGTGGSGEAETAETVPAPSEGTAGT